MKNVSDMTQMTADKLQNIMKVIILVLDNLYESNGEEEVSNEWLCQSIPQISSNVSCYT